MVDAAANIFAFDAALDNSDRRVSNANCLTDGDRFAVLDHELTFLFATLFWKPPWVDMSLEYWKTGEPHIFFRQLIGKPVTLRELEDRLGRIGSERCDQYLATLPPEWDREKERAIKMVGYVREMVLNAPAMTDEIRRVLS